MENDCDLRAERLNAIILAHIIVSFTYYKTEKEVHIQLM